jgi:hypothetical protein
MPAEQWFAVTYRGTAEMTVWVRAESASDAKAKAEDVQYEDATSVEFVKGKPYTMKAAPAPDYTPPEEWER